MGDGSGDGTVAWAVMHENMVARTREVRALTAERDALAARVDALEAAHREAVVVAAEWREAERDRSQRIDWIYNDAHACLKHAYQEGDHADPRVPNALLEKLARTLAVRPYWK